MNQSCSVLLSAFDYNIVGRGGYCTKGHCTLVQIGHLAESTMAGDLSLVKL